MARTFLKYFIRITGIAVFLIAANSGMLFLWLVNAPREIPFLASRIESAVASFSPDFSVKVSKAVLQWDGRDQGIGIHLNDVGVYNPEQVNVAVFPDIRVNLDLMSLVLGDIEFKDTRITKPRFIINTPAKIGETITAEGEPEISPQQEVFGPVPVSTYRKVIIDILSAIERNNKHIPIKNIHMRQVQLVVDKGAEEIAWEIPAFNVNFTSAGGSVMFQSDMVITHHGKDMTLAMEGFLEAQQVLHVSIKAGGLTPSFITDTVPEVAWFAPLEILLDGTAEIRLSPEGQLDSVKFEAVTTAPDNPELPEFALKASGAVTMHEAEGDKPAGPEVHMDVKMTDLPVDMLQKFWPPEYARDARDWLMPHIISGHYDKADLSINLTPEEAVSGIIAPDSIKASLSFSNMELSYYEKFPRLLEGQGIATFSTDSVDITVASAKFGDSIVPGAKIKIIDLDKDDVRMEIDGHLTGSMADLLSFQVMDKEALTSQIKPTSGTAETHFVVAFPLLADLDLEDITMTVTSEIKDLAIDEVAKGLSIRGGNFHMALEGNKLSVKGETFLGNAQATITYEEDYNEQREFDRRYAVSSFMTPQELPVPELASALADYINGPMKLDLNITEKGDEQDIEGNIWLGGAEMKVPEFGWLKPKDKGAQLTFALSGGAGGKPMELKSVVLAAENFLISGKGKVEPKAPYVDINFDKVLFNGNNFSTKLLFDGTKKFYRVTLDGRHINAGPLINYLLTEESKEDKEEYASDILVNARYLTLSNNVRLHDVSGSVHCNKKFCEEATFGGAFKNGARLDVRYAPVTDGKDTETRRLLVRSGNAGGVFRGLDLLTQIKGGMLEASAISDPKGKGLYEGKMIVKDFKAVNAPILGRLLTLASLTGIVDILGGSGISFKKLDGQFAYDALGQITINELEAAGNSIGITLDGTINTSTDQLKLDGAVIPAYSINSLLGDIPLIGDTLIGKKGEGLIATRYSVEGSFNDPKISVNPFSMLTPGFLRKVWGSNAAPENIAVPEEKIEIVPEKKKTKKPASQAPKQNFGKKE